MKIARSCIALVAPLLIGVAPTSAQEAPTYRLYVANESSDLVSRVAFTPGVGAEIEAQIPINQFGTIYSGLNNPEFAFGDGIRCVGMSVLRSAIINSGPGGTINIMDALNAGNLSAGASDVGLTRYCQGWYRDPSGGPNGFNLSDGLSASFCP